MMRSNHQQNLHIQKEVLALLAFSAALALCLPLSALAFFGDAEHSNGNAFGASSLDLTLSATQTDEDSRTVDLTNSSPQALSYEISVTESSDPLASLCSNINVSVDGGAEVDLLSFVQPTTQLANGAHQTLTYEFSVDSTNDAHANKTCAVSFIHKANQLGYVHGEAFFDTETDAFVLSSGDFGITDSGAPVATTNIVLNEVYAQENNASSSPLEREWVELYNGTGAAIDVEDWSMSEIETSEVLHVISASNTCASGSKEGFARPYNNAPTLIPAGGHLVIEFCAANRLNNDGDTIRLYDGGAIEVDEYTYTSSILGKSDARIPDGGAWIDPLPTPGQPNKLEESSNDDSAHSSDADHSAQGEDTSAPAAFTFADNSTGEQTPDTDASLPLKDEKAVIPPADEPDDGSNDDFEDENDDPADGTGGTTGGAPGTGEEAPAVTNDPIE